MDKSIKIGISGIGILSGITLAAGLVLSIPNVKADDSLTDNVSFVIGTSCTMAVDENSTTAHTITMNNGATESEIGKTRINVFCNDANGYTVYALGFSGDLYGYNKLIASGIAIKYDIATGTTGTSSSRWAMKLTGGGGVDSPTIISPYDNYAAVPDDLAEVAHRTSSTNMTSSADKPYFDTTYQVYISSDQPAATYIGKVKYIMVHPESSHSRTINDIVYLQDFAEMTQSERTSVISSMTMETTYTKKDRRDNQDYTIAKLADGNIWMTKNLNLAGGTMLSSETTDFDASYTIPENQGWQTGGTLPASSTTGFTNDNYAYVYNSGSTNCGANSPCYSYYSWDAATLGSGRNLSTVDTDAPYSICPKGWKLPNANLTNNFNSNLLYLFYNIRYRSGAASMQDIMNTVFGQVYNFQRAGSYYNGTFTGGGIDGDYQSSTSHSNNNYNRFLFFSTDELGTGNTPRRYGIPVKCLVRKE